MKADEGIIARSPTVSLQAVAEAFFAADSRLSALLERQALGFGGYAATRRWCDDVSEWASGMVFADIMLSLEGYRPPELFFHEDPDQFIAAWAAFFDKVRDRVLGETDQPLQPVASRSAN